jgi:acetyltransferase
VNPNYAESEILGVPVHPTVDAIPAGVDIAYVVTPAEVVPSVVQDCGDAGVAGVVVMAAGFSEEGNERLEGETVRIARENGIRIVGPNINGMFNTAVNLDLVGIGMSNIPRGNVSILSQSGNFASSVIHKANTEGWVGFDLYVGIGNEADIGFDEYLGFLAERDTTDGILMYIEGLNNGEAFVRRASGITPEKPIVVLKGGGSEAGKRSARSHTGSIAGNSDVVADVFSQAGIVTVDRWDETLPVMKTLVDVPAAAGDNVGIITDGGGHATHAADSLSKRGLHVPDLQRDTQEAIRERVPEAGNASNPVDLLTLEGDMERLVDCARIMIADGAIDALLVCGFYGGYNHRFAGESAETEVEVGRELEQLSEEFGVPVIVQSLYGNTDIDSIRGLKDLDVPILSSINRAVASIEASVTYGRHLETHDRKSDLYPSSDTAKRTTSPNGRVSEAEARSILQEYDLPIVEWDVARTADEAVRIADKFGTPVSMKVVSAEIPHKTDVGGVELDIVGREAVRRGFDSIRENVNSSRPDSQVDGVLISPMVDEGQELVVGMVRDEEVGPVIMFGLGGVFVEALEDVSFRGVPLTEFDARELIGGIRSESLLDGIRGQERVDRDALTDLLLKVSEVTVANPRIEEFELNPIIANGDALSIVDVNMTMSRE